MAQSIAFTQSPSGRIIGLLGLIILADYFLWDVHPGLSFVVLFLCIAVAAQTLWGRFNWQAWVVLGISLIPAIEDMQALSFAFALGGLAAFCAIQVCGGWDDLGRVVRATSRMPFWGNVQTVQDIAAGMQMPHDLGQSAAKGLSGLRDWAVPAVLGIVFVALFAMANPVIDGWLVGLIPAQGPVLPDLARIILWVLIAVFVWPMLRLSALAGRLLRPAIPHATRDHHVLTEGSVLRSLVTFNVIFAVQTVLDLAYLSGGVSLPDGIGYAEYAHRGAYSLLATALLAGGFALLAQPWLKGRPILKWLLLAWVAQNVVLVFSSILRLDLYVDVYGLTRLRFAAFVWMSLVAMGLALMIWQVWRGWAVSWLIGQSAALAVLALFVTALVNVDGYIARHNLSHHGNDADTYYLCQLSEGAVPALRAFELQTGKAVCHSRGLHVFAPHDWREWGYRNARLRHKLNEIEGLSQ